MPRRGGRRNRNRPNTPESMMEFHSQLSQRFNHMTLFNDVSLYSGVINNNPIEGITLVFMLPNVNEILKTGSTFAFNTTFAHGPSFGNNNQQLYVIMGVHGDKGFPIVFALMTKKTESAYTALYNKILSIEPEWKPKTIIVNFEQAAIASIKSVFPNTKIHGCWFYFCEQICQHIDSSGLSFVYNTNRAVYNCVHMLMSLPLLPKEYILKGFLEITKQFGHGIYSTGLSSEFNTKFNSFFQWYRSTWLEGINATILSVNDVLFPIIEIEQCCLHVQINMENLFNPEPWTFIKNLITYTNIVVLDYQMVNAGRYNVLENVRRKWIPNMLILHSLTSRFLENSCSILEFLTGVMVITPFFDFQTPDNRGFISRLVPPHLLEIVKRNSTGIPIQEFGDSEYEGSSSDDDFYYIDTSEDESSSSEDEAPDPPPKVITFRRREMKFAPLVEDTCCICLTDRPVVIASPCLHQCLCTTCHKKFLEMPPHHQKPSYRCALCRSQVDLYIIVN